MTGSIMILIVPPFVQFITDLLSKASAPSNFTLNLGSFHLELGLKVASQSCAILYNATPPENIPTPQAPTHKAAAAQPIGPLAATTTTSAATAMPAHKASKPPQKLPLTMHSKEPLNFLSSLFSNGNLLL